MRAGGFGVHRWVKVAAIFAVAVPAFGIAFLVLREVAREPGGDALNSAFHLVLGATLVLLFVDFLTAIRRSGDVRMTLALGVGGFACCLAGAVLSEVLGPPALALLLVSAAAWGLVLLRSGSGGRAEEVVPE